MLFLILPCTFTAFYKIVRNYKNFFGYSQNFACSKSQFGDKSEK
jgi:hypothetical protein